MAEAMLSQSRLRLQFKTGINEKGDPTYKTKTFNNIKSTATATQLFSTAMALGSLSQYDLNSVERNDSFDIVE